MPEVSEAVQQQVHHAPTCKHVFMYMYLSFPPDLNVFLCAFTSFFPLFVKLCSAECVNFLPSTWTAPNSIHHFSVQPCQDHFIKAVASTSGHLQAILQQIFTTPHRRAHGNFCESGHPVKSPSMETYQISIIKT